MTRRIVSKFMVRNGAQPFFFPRSWRAPDGALATIMEVGRESTLFPCPWRAKEGALPHHHGDRLLVDSFYKVYQGRSLPTQDHGGSKSELYHHHGDRPPVNSFLPGVPSYCTQNQACHPGAPKISATFLLYPKSWRAQEGALS